MSNIVQTPFEARHIGFSGPPVTWAGEYPGIGYGFCFGTEAGGLWLTGLDRYIQKAPILVVPSGEAVNGVAFTRNLMAVSTRAEVVINKFAAPSGPVREEFVYEGGAHGVIATDRGALLAPLGPTGLLHGVPDDHGRFNLREIRARGADLYFYKVAHLGRSDSGEEIFAGAGRTDGLMMIALKDDGLDGDITTKRGLSATDGAESDLIDICGLGSPRYPFAFAGLGIDNTLHLGRDLRGGESISLRYPQMRGTAYSIHEAQGHLFLLMSSGIYAMPRLAEQFLKGGSLDGRSTVHRIAVEAVDAAIVYGEYLLVIQANRVSILRVSKLAGDPSEYDEGSDREGLAAEAEAIEMVTEFEDSPWLSPSAFALESLVLV